MLNRFWKSGYVTVKSRSVGRTADSVMLMETLRANQSLYFRCNIVGQASRHRSTRPIRRDVLAGSRQERPCIKTLPPLSPSSIS